MTATTTVHDTVKRTLEGLQYMRMIAQGDMPLQYLCVLLHISLQGGAVSKTLLESSLGISHSTMSRILQRLGSGHGSSQKLKGGLGLIVTEENPADWRLKQARLTPEGKEVIKTMAEIILKETGA